MSTLNFGRDERDRDPLLRRVGSLPREVDPPQDLWPAIRAGIERADRPEPVAARSRPAPRALALTWGWALAAGVGVAAVSVVFTWLAVRPPAGEAPVQVAAEQAPTAVEALRPVAYGRYARLGPEYVELRAQMLEQFRARLAELPDATRLRVEGDLAAIQKAADDIDAALAGDPASRLLNQLLLSTYQEELRLYSSLAAANDATGQRT